MYSGMSNINYVDVSGLDTQNVTTMNNVFSLLGSINSNLKNIVSAFVSSVLLADRLCVCSIADLLLLFYVRP